MRFDLPFVPDPHYAHLLAAHRDRIASVHFGLYLEQTADARHSCPEYSFDDLAAALPLLGEVPRYALANARFQDAQGYFVLDPLLDALTRLFEAGLCDGVVLVDLLLATAMAQAAPKLCAKLELVPGINCGFDSADKVAAWFRWTRDLPFKPTTKITLDRDLNRKGPELDALIAEVRAMRSHIQVGLLANEGCLTACPFRGAHEGLIGLGRGPCGPLDAAKPVRRFGCTPLFAASPHQILSSPFIRPEDADGFAGRIDHLKLCGRTRPVAALQRLVKAYFEGRFDGNLLDILDAVEGLAEAVVIDNRSLDGVTLPVCRGECQDCRRCMALKGKIQRRSGAGLGAASFGGRGGL